VSSGGEGENEEGVRERARAGRGRGLGVQFMEDGREMKGRPGWEERRPRLQGAIDGVHQWRGEWGGSNGRVDAPLTRGDERTGARLLARRGPARSA
jgi:hypothetical protein